MHTRLSENFHAVFYAPFCVAGDDGQTSRGERTALHSIPATIMAGGRGQCRRRGNGRGDSKLAIQYHDAAVDLL